MSYVSLHPSFTRYETDGRGRDMYINYNNGGFWKYNFYKIKYTPSYDYSKNINYHSLGHMAAPFTYYSDGSGRDSYILRCYGLQRNFKPSNMNHLKDFLRTPESCTYKPRNSSSNNNGSRTKTHFVTKKEFFANKQLRNIEDGLINRLYKKEKYKFLPNLNNIPAKTVSNFNFNKYKYCITCKSQEKIKNINNFKICATEPDYKQQFFRDGIKKVRVLKDEI